MGVLVKVKEIKATDEYEIKGGPRAGNVMYSQYIIAFDENRREYPIKVNSISKDKWKVGDKFEATITDSVWQHDGENYNQTKASVPGSSYGSGGGSGQQRPQSGNGHAQPQAARGPRATDTEAMAALVESKFNAAVVVVAHYLRKSGERYSVAEAEAKVRADLAVGSAYLEWASGIGTTIFLGIQRGEFERTYQTAEELPPSVVDDDSEIPF